MAYNIPTGRIKETISYDSTIATDGGLENWESTINDASDWGWDWTGDGDGGRVTRSSDSYFGTYAAKMETVETFGGAGAGYSRPYIYQEVGLTEPNDIAIGFRGKGAVGNEVVGITILNNTIDTFTQAYNWSTNGWVNKNDIDVVLADADYVQQKTLTTAYALYTSEDLSKSGTVHTVVIQNCQEATRTTYIDNVFVGDSVTSGSETWEYNLTDWELFGNTAANRPIISTDSDTGTYAVQSQGGSMMCQDVSGLTPDDSYTATIRAKSTSGSSVFYFVFGYDVGEDVYMWNFTGGNAGTYTLTPGVPSADQLNEKTTTGSYATYTTTDSQPTVPEGGSFWMTIYSEANDVFWDNATLKKDGTGPDVFTNSGFETWTVGGYLADGSLESPWSSNSILTSWGTYITNDISREDTAIHGGTYAAKFTLDLQDGGFIQQYHSGLTPGDDYRILFWAKYLTNASNFSVTVFNDNFNAATHYYDFGTTTWTALGSPTGDEKTVTADYASYNSIVPVPASGNLNVVVSHAYVATEGSVAYLDDLAVQKIIYPTQATLVDFANPSDADNLLEDDVIMDIHTTGGTPASQFKGTINASDYLAITSDRTGIDMSAQPLVVGTPSTATEATTKGYTDTADDIRLLYTTLSAELDMVSLGATVDLYTVPTGYTFYPVSTWEICTEVDAFSMSGTVTFGSNDPSYNNGSGSISISSTINQVNTYALIGTQGFTAGNLIKAKVSVVATATALKGKIRLIGFLVAT